MEVRWLVMRKREAVSYHCFECYLGLRPFGVSLLYAGYDAHHSFQLYHSDPSGNYSGWKVSE